MSLAGGLRIAAALLALAGGAAPAADRGPARTLEELEAGIAQRLEEAGAPGAAAALVSREKGTYWARGFGLADREAGRPATADTPFRVGSISKSFVGLAVLRLVEQGRLALDDRLAELAPEVEFDNPWEASEPVRLVHLLEHTAGFDDMHLPEYAHNRPEPIALADALAFHPHSRRSRWPPGTHVSYCNAGPAIAAYVVEKASGRRFEDHVEATQFAPLGMERASYFASDEIAGDLAIGYRGDGGEPVPYWHILVRPSGAVNASARELARLVELLVGRGTIGDVELLSPASIERMERPASSRAARAGVEPGYGLGNFASHFEGFFFHGHDGGLEGGVASYGYLPGPGVGYVLMLNSTNVAAYRGIRELLRRYLVRDLEPAAPEPAALDAGELARLDGWYEPAAPRQEVTRFLLRLAGRLRLAAREGRLEARGLGGATHTLVPVAGGRFRVDELPVATAAVVAPGEIEVAAGPLRGSWRRAPTVLHWIEALLAVACLLLAASPGFFALVWVPRKLFGRLRGATHLSVRWLPLASCLALAGAAAIVMLSAGDFIGSFGRPTPRSVAFVALLLASPLLALAGLARLWATRGEPIHRAVRAHALAASLALLAWALYLARWGVLARLPWS